MKASISAILVAAVAAASYTNPVTSADDPDPGVAYENGSYWVATTSGDAKQAYPIRKSSDLVNWSVTGYVFPSGWPSWVKSDLWAPELHKVDGKWLCYFAARHTDGTLSVGVAISTAGIGGPYKDIGHPIVHTPGMGNIDPTYYFDEATGQSYLIYKRDGNAVGQPTPIFIVKLAANGTTITSSPIQLITNTLSWEGAVTEAPWIINNNGTYYLFYSGNGYAGDAYAVGVAWSKSITGPYTKNPSPIVHTDMAHQPGMHGPGHCSVVKAPSGKWAIVYHAWNAAQTQRQLMVDDLVWSSSGVPSTPGDVPSRTAQPMPL